MFQDFSSSAPHESGSSFKPAGITDLGFAAKRNRIFSNETCESLRFKISMGDHEASVPVPVILPQPRNLPAHPATLLAPEKCLAADRTGDFLRRLRIASAASVGKSTV